MRTTAESHKGGRILLVDDDHVVLETFGLTLRMEGYDVYTAEDANAGLAIAADVRLNAIILDLHMPIIDGVGLLRRLRALPNAGDIPVAIVTGDYLIDEATIATLQSLGTQVHFKPLWLEDLLALARKLCG